MPLHYPSSDEANFLKTLCASERGSLEYENTAVVDKFGIDMTNAKFRCLKPGEWLNDEIISFYMSMLNERDAFQRKASGRDSTRIFQKGA
jgi:Ulp1 family protease